MARDKFEVRFDKHGHMLIEDAELAHRIVYLLQNQGSITMRIDAAAPAQAALPNYLECLTIQPTPMPRPVPLNYRNCPMSMCECTLRVVDSRRWAEQWEGLRDEDREHGGR
ncbi:MAG: hypothetical protein NTY35_12805 [Planctomycetota bacterium]|nr:hypothetical protein [Planctomycetota bacterium]